MKTRLSQALLVSFAAIFCSTVNPAALAENAVVKMALPADFPELNRNEDANWLTSNGSGMESKVQKLFSVNYKLLRQLDGYTPDSIAAVFGERMIKEQDVHIKLLLASIAAERGHEESGKFILKMAENIDYETTISRLYALRPLVNAPHPPEWVFEAVHQALGDTRIATGMEKSRWGRGQQFEISYLADEETFLTYDLGTAKNRKSVPVLIEMAKRTDGSRGPVQALGRIGDPRGIPICLEFLAQEDAAINAKKASDSAPREELTGALAGLKAKDAVPTLLNYLYSEHVIKALGGIGDERAIEPLRRIVASHGHVDPDPYTWAARFQQRSFAARMALIKLEPDDPVPRWIAVTQDMSLEWAQRREAVWELGSHPDPRAISPLLSLVKSDLNGAVVNQSITVLSAYRYKAVVAGLIECFDADFAGKSDWKRANTPAMFSENIAKALHILTGQDFGSDKTQWAKWWNETGKNIENLK